MSKCGSHRETKHPDLFEDYDKDDPNHIWKVTLRKKSENTHEISYVAFNLDNDIVFDKKDDLSMLSD